MSWSAREIERASLLASPATLAEALTRKLPPEQRWIKARHLAHLARIIASLVWEGDGRLIVTMPPRHGKSELVSHWLPAWFLELWPHRRVICASYEADFAATWGRKVRNTIDRHPRELSVRVAQDSSAAVRWDTIEGGGMVTAGVGGAITGRGADLLVIDDPVKNREQADSRTYQEKTWDWWTSTARTRLEPQGTIVIMHTRWNEADLAGRLLRNDPSGDRWTVCNFPAIAEEEDVLGRQPGEALWPERYPLAALNALRSGPDAIASRDWASLYQQSPVVEGGELFKRDYFRYFRPDGDDHWLLLRPDAEPIRWAKSECVIAQTVDTALTERKTSDWTACLTFMTTPDRQLLILDSTRARLEVPRQLPWLHQLRERWSPAWQGVEDKGGGTSVLQFAARQGYPLRPLKPGTQDKRTRAFDAIAMYEQGLVYHLQDAPWLAIFEGELVSFDRGKHDDQVDTVAYAARSMRRADPQIIVI